MKYTSLVRWISRRGPFAAENSTVFTAERGALTTPIAFGVAGVIEIVAVHVLVPWPWLQWTLLAVSVWSLLLFAATLAHHRMHPHTLSIDTLTLKTSGRTVTEIPRASIVGARVHRRYRDVAAAIENGRLFLPTQDGTNVDIDVSAPVDAVIPSVVSKWRVQGSVSSIAVQVDDPAALTRALTHPRTVPTRRTGSSGCDA